MHRLRGTVLAEILVLTTLALTPAIVEHSTPAGAVSAPAVSRVAAPRQTPGLSRLTKKATLSTIPPPATGSRATARPFLTPNAVTTSSPGLAPLIPSSIIGSGSPGAPQTSPGMYAASSGTTLEELQAFPASSFGSDPVQTAPPDTQLGVGPSYVGEAVNDALTIWSRAGALVGSYDLNTFFSVPVASGYTFTDPRIIYDTLSGRWFLSGFAVDSSSDSIVYLATSYSSNPTGGWYIYQLATSTGTVTDQPKIGVSSDKVVISWNDYSSTALLEGEQTWVLQKSDLTSGANVSESQFALDNTRFDIVPAISQSASGTEYLVYNDSCSASNGTGTGSCTTGSPALGVVAITGTPAAGDVSWNESDPAIAATLNPPSATEPGGQSIDTNDDRLLSAVWQNGVLWTAGNDACTPSGDTTVRPCLRLIEVSTGGFSPSVLLDGDIGQAGDGLYYPAVALDSSGNPYVVATVSSASIYPSVIAYGKSPTSAYFVGGYLWNGSGNYSCSFCSGGNGSLGGNRWGDYSGAAVDPSNPNDIWVAGEYATASGGDYWATAVGELTYAAPTVANISPTSGPIAGGTSVVINGANFTPGTTVAFGGYAATTVSVRSSTTLVATSPPEAAGSVNITVATADGTSSASPADVFSYTTLPGAPTSVSARAGNNSATITWVAPAFDGGTPITGYLVTASNGSTFTVGNTTTDTVTGLANGTAYSFTVAAINAVGTGPSSIASNSVTPIFHGYWLVASDGGIFSFGDASFYGSTGNIVLNKPIVGMASTPDGKGYWLVASDGGIFSFGDASFYGSTGNIVLNKPIVGMAS